MSKFLYLLTLLFPLTIAAQEKLQFVGEKIDFAIDSSRFSVNGIYTFVNISPNDINQTIFYPFAKGASSVEFKRVFNLSYSRNINFTLKESGAVFKLFIASADTIRVNISYSQKTGKENVYILRSTQYWNRPLQFAEYTLTTDRSVSIDSVSYAPDRIEENVYYYRKVDFFPYEDFVVIIK
jgi:hypothetical protein